MNRVENQTPIDSVFLSLRSGQASTTTPASGLGRSKDRGHNRTGEDACSGR